MKEIEDINIYLERFGKNPRGKSIFRVIWSEDQIIVRKGTFNEFYNDIFVRTVTGFKPTKKYWDIPEKYILEQWFPPEKMFDPNIPETKNGDYIPLYVFQNEKGEANPIEVIRKITEIYMKELIKNRTNRMLRKSLDLQEFEDKEKAELKHDIDILDPDSVNYLRSKEIVGYTKDLEKKDEFGNES